MNRNKDMTKKKVECQIELNDETPAKLEPDNNLCVLYFKSEYTNDYPSRYEADIGNEEF